MTVRVLSIWYIGFELWNHDILGQKCFILRLAPHTYLWNALGILCKKRPLISLHSQGHYNGRAGNITVKPVKAADINNSQTSIMSLVELPIHSRLRAQSIHDVCASGLFGFSSHSLNCSFTSSRTISCQFKLTQTVAYCVSTDLTSLAC